MPHDEQSPRLRAMEAALDPGTLELEQELRDLYSAAERRAATRRDLWQGADPRVWGDALNFMRMLIPAPRDSYDPDPANTIGAATPEERVPRVYRHPDFIPDPPMILTPALQEVARRILRLAPGAKERITSITAAPAPGAIHLLLESDIDPGEFARTNLLGTYNRRVGNITLNPRFSRDPTGAAEVFAHEVGHATGLGEEEGALANIEGVTRMLEEWRRARERKP